MALTVKIEKNFIGICQASAFQRWQRSNCCFCKPCQIP